MAKTKKPTGLAITRKNNTITFAWKIADSDYASGHQLQYRFSTDKKGTWRSISIGAKTTSKAISIPIDSLYPNSGKPKLSAITFRVRGKRKKYTTGSGTKKKTYTPGWSDWAKKVYELKAPGKPAITAALDETLDNRTKFDWSITINATNNQEFRDIEWQTILLKNSNEKDGATAFKTKNPIASGSGTTGSTGSKTITEDTALTAYDSYTRWVRVRARGVRGASDWAYAKHVYARPNQAIVKSATAKLNNAEGYQCTVVWEAAASYANPIDKAIVQYAIVTPEEGMSCPSGASWSDGAQVADTGENDAITFSIDDVLSTDECLFVRINTYHDHDSNTTYGAPTLVAGGVGNLADPEGITVETDNATHRATITATNRSSVSDSYLAITYMGSEDPQNAFVVGIIPHGQDSVTLQCPDWSNESTVAFGVRAVVGSYRITERDDGARCYAIEEPPLMISSNTVWEGGEVPAAPRDVQVSPTNIQGTVRVTWDWPWNAATSATISWADHEDAWESTSEPSTYDISNLRAAAWNISDLETGKPWYIRVRLSSGTGDNKTHSPWSDIVKIDLSSAPTIPVLMLSEGIITEEGSVTASWGYSSTDGTAQAFAEICQATIDNGTITYGDTIVQTQTAQHATLNAKELGWTAGNTYLLCVRVVSASGRTSDSWSDPVPIMVADPLVCEITQTSLQTVTVVDDEEEQVTRDVTALTEMPLSVTVTGAGMAGTTTVAIERAQSYHMDRPDESQFDGHEGETIVIKQQTGEAEITIEPTDLIGALDDGASYRLVATVSDTIGQTATAEIEFEVRWAHQAVIPDAIVEMDPDNYIAKITPIAPEGTGEGDVCDIYRLSADRPELIVQNGQWGETYVDPYPAIGEMGGHRIVFKTVNGDYITADNQPAWIDLYEEDGDYLGIDHAIIDFDGERILVILNVELSSSWEKDFQETQYLGGSVTGDWNPAVSRKGSIGAVVQTSDVDVIKALRRLATHSGICHVRTQDGSSYAADVQLSGTQSFETAGKIDRISLSITRVDSEGFDGLPYSQWITPEE